MLQRCFFSSGDRHSDPGERQDLHQSTETERGGGAHQEARSRGSQSRERQEREGAEGEGQIDALSSTVMSCVCERVRVNFSMDVTACLFALVLFLKINPND